MTAKKGEHWMIKSIVIHPNKKCDVPDEFGNYIRTDHYQKHILKVFNYPHWIHKKWGWYVNYWHARMQVRFPRHYVSISCYGYYPDKEGDLETRKKQQIASAKAQVTKFENLIRWRRHQLSTQLFQEENSDPLMIEIRAKLEEKKFKLEQTIL